MIHSPMQVLIYKTNQASRCVGSGGYVAASIPLEDLFWPELKHILYP